MTSFVGIIDYANSLTNGFAGIGILVVIAIISFLTTKSFASETAFAFSTFVSLLVAILLRFMGLINDITLYIVVIAFVGSLIYLHFNREKEEV